MTEYLQSILKSMLHISLLSTIMVPLILLIRFMVIRRTWAKFSYLLWLILLLRLIFPFSFSSILSVENYISEPFEVFYEDNTVVENNSVNPGLITYGTLNKAVYNYPDTLDKTLEIGIYVWLFGIFAVLFLPVISYRTLRKAIDMDDLADERDIQSLLYRASKMVGITRATLRYSYYIDSPALIGVLSPVIVLPYNMEDADEETLLHVFLHELVHLSKGHLFFQWLFWFVKALYWFNPLVWLAHEWMKMDAELACDDEVIRLLGEGSENDYGKELIRIAEGTEKNPYAVNAAGLINRSSELKKRIKRIASGKKRPRILTWLTVAASIVMLPVFFTGMSFAVTNNPWYFDKSVSEAPSANEYISMDLQSYSYDSETGQFNVKLHTSFTELLADRLPHTKNVTLYFELYFPESYDPNLRKEGYSDGVQLEFIASDSQFVDLSFDVADYDIDAYGQPLLIFAGGDIQIDVMDTDSTLTVDDIPHRIIVDDIVEVTVTSLHFGSGRTLLAYDIHSSLDTVQDKNESIGRIYIHDSVNLRDSNGHFVDTNGISGEIGNQHVSLEIDTNEMSETPTELTLHINSYNIGLGDYSYGYGLRVYNDQDNQLQWKLSVTEGDIHELEN